jgi:hypothetical protein
MKNQKLFLLTSAIFSHFDGFDFTEKQPVDEAEKFQKTIENLKRQQDVVRQNMVFLTKQRAEYVQVRARDEIRRLEELSTPKEFEREEAEERARTEKLRNVHKRSLMARLSAPLKPDAKPEDLLIDLRLLNSIDPDTATSGVEDGLNDTELSGTTFTKRTPSIIREEAGKELQEIITLTTCELEGYDIHCKHVLSRYQAVLESQMSTNSEVSGTMAPPRSVLRTASGNTPPNVGRRGSAGLS